MLLAATKILSDASFVAPYRLMGVAALSVESAMTFSTPSSIAAVITFSAPWMFVLMHSRGLYSAAGTCFSAAACTTKLTSRIASLRRAWSRTSPMK